MKKRDEKFEVVSNRLRELRKKAGLSNEKLVTIFKEKYGIGISKITLQKYEVAEFNHTHYGSVEGMRLEYLYMFADFYNVSADYLLGRTDAPTVDADLRGTVDYTGLSATSVKNLRSYANSWDKGKKVLNKALERGFFYDFFSCLALSIVAKAEAKKLEAEPGQENIRKFLFDVRDMAAFEFICEKHVRKLINSISEEEVLKFAEEWQGELSNDEKILKIRMGISDI